MFDYRSVTTYVRHLMIDSKYLNHFLNALNDAEKKIASIGLLDDETEVEGLIILHQPMVISSTFSMGLLLGGFPTSRSMLNVYLRTVSPLPTFLAQIYVKCT